MKLTSKPISVGNMKINATWTREMADDLMNFGKCYQYKFENTKEKEIIEKYFNVEFLDVDTIYYSLLTRQERRKIKLLILEKNEISDIIEKILKSSVVISSSDIMERKLSHELAREIDKEILNKLRSYSSNPIRYI